MLWLALLTTPMMAAIQGMCARIGMVTGRGLAANIRQTVPAWAAYTMALAVIAANTFNAGADFAGMAASAHLLAPAIPAPGFVVFFGVVLLLAMVFLSYRRFAEIIKWLTISLFAYVVAAFLIHPRWGEVLKHLVVPEIRFNRGWITTMMGVLGTTITPYLFFWQSSLEVEEEKAMGRRRLRDRRGATADEIRDAHFDVNAGMIFSNAVMFFIIATTALTLYAHGKTNIQTAQDAARALEPLAGRFAALLFMLGMVGTGLLAIPALACSSAYVAAETFAFKGGGLGDTPRRARGFYAVTVAGIFAAVLMTFIGLNPIRALYWAAVINGVVAVPLIFLLIRIASDRRIMGEWVSSLAAKIWAWLTFTLMALAAIALFAV